MRLGDICRMSKNHILNDSNKMSFALLGDPMLRLAYPECNVVTDSITLLDGGVYDTLSALSVMKISLMIRGATEHLIGLLRSYHLQAEELTIQQSCLNIDLQECANIGSWMLKRAESVSITLYRTT